MGGKKEIYQYIRFFHGAIQLLLGSFFCLPNFELESSPLLVIGYHAKSHSTMSDSLEVSGRNKQ